MVAVTTNSRFDAFLKTSIEEPAAFSRALLAAARELRALELGVGYGGMVFEGDAPALGEINRQSLRPAQSAYEGWHPFDIAAHLAKVAAHWSSQGKATLYRGTRLPDVAGSFGFGIHVTPQVDIASAYAAGKANVSTGTGRLLGRDEIGFVHAFEVPLEEKTFKNFQYEDALADPSRAPTLTLRDLLDSMRALAGEPGNSFEEAQDGAIGPGLRQWGQLAGTHQHYEVVLAQDRPAAAMYLHHTNGFIKVNASNPHWSQLLARVQEACLRDFYEIRPLDRAIESLEHARSRAGDDADKLALIAQVRQWVERERVQRLGAPWEAASLKDVALQGSSYQAGRPHIALSHRVGSSMEASRLRLPAAIASWVQVCEALQMDDQERARALLQTLRPQQAPAALNDQGQALELLTHGAAQAAEVARRHASASLLRLNWLVRVYASGQDTGRRAYEELSKAGYVAAYDLQTYAQTCAALGVRPEAQCEHISAAAQAMLARVQDHEAAYLTNALSPSEVFYDDMLDVAYLEKSHAPVNLSRVARLAGERPMPSPMDEAMVEQFHG